MPDQAPSRQCAGTMTSRNAPIVLHSKIDPEKGDWLHLVPAGTFRGLDGRGPYRVGDDAAVIAQSMKGGKLVIDENHSTDLAAKQGHSAPARGWITQLESRADGIWGKAEWTGSGKALMADQAYRGISPVLRHDPETGEVLGILRAALTNDPNLPLTALHSQSHQENSMSLAAAIRAALGLSADADDAAITAAVTTLHSAKATLEADQAAAFKAIAEAAGIKADAAKPFDAAQIVTSLQASRTTGDTDAAQLRQTVVTLQSQLDGIQASTAKDKATRFVDDAIRDGKPIKALRDHYIARHAKDPASVETEVKAMVSINAGGIVAAHRPDAGGGGAALSVQDIQAKATLHQKQMKEAGVDVDYGTAVRHVTAS